MGRKVKIEKTLGAVEPNCLKRLKLPSQISAPPAPHHWIPDQIRKLIYKT